MRGKTHLIVGLAVGNLLGHMCYTSTGDTSVALMFLTGSAVGSIFPDIDLPESAIGRRIPLLPRFLNRVFGHRGFLHSLLCVLLICGVADFFFPGITPMFTGFACGFLSHIILDILNPMGIALLWPWGHKFHVAEIPSDVPFQEIVALVVLVLSTLTCLIFL